MRAYVRSLSILICTKSRHCECEYRLFLHLAEAKNNNDQAFEAKSFSRLLVYLCNRSGRIYSMKHTVAGRLSAWSLWKQLVGS